MYAPLIRIVRTEFFVPVNLAVYPQVSPTEFNSDTQPLQ
jgi:hypothetical protein